MKSILLLFTLSGVLLAAPVPEKFSPAVVRSSADGGASVAAWFEGPHLRKIVLWVSLSSRERKETYIYSDDGSLISAAVFDRSFAIDDATGKLDPSRTDGTVEAGHHFDQDASATESQENRAACQKLGTWLYKQLLSKPRTLDLTGLSAGDTSPRKEK